MMNSLVYNTSAPLWRATILSSGLFGMMCKIAADVHVIVVGFNFQYQVAEKIVLAMLKT